MKKLVLGIMLTACAAFVFGQSLVKRNYELNTSNKVVKMVQTQQNGAKGTGVDNANFESWNGTLAGFGLGQMPNGWLMITGNPGGQQSSNAQAGTYSAHVESNVVTNAVLGFTDTLIGGTAFIGRFTGSALVSGEAYTSNLISIDGYIRGSLLSNDTAIIVVQTYNGGQGAEVGMGALLFGPNQVSTTWTAFNLPIEIEPGAPAPDSIVIFISSTGVGLFQDMDMGTLTAGSWIEVDNFTYNVEVPTSPVASVNPASWAAGSVQLGSGATSPTFTLTNTGTGTLTVSNATALSAPWSTTFNAGAVSLAAGASYTFTFGFNPTVAGAANQSFVLTTNGGNLTINLTGTGVSATAVMDGGFENNVADFDMEFTGWVQHDNDASGTYGFQGTTFTNSGYTGAFIAFNPASTSPAMTDAAIQPHAGVRFGACFAATTPPNNDWLITPQSPVLNNGALLRMYVKSYTSQYGLERYSVNVSTTGTAVANFTKISAGTYVEAPATEWTYVEYDLSAYQGQQIYVGINCVSNDAFIFMVDDIEIYNPVGVDNNTIKTVAVYPNPASEFVTITNAENQTLVITDMLGKVVARINVSSSLETIDISNLNQGTYFMNINGKVSKLNIVK